VIITQDFAETLRPKWKKASRCHSKENGKADEEAQTHGGESLPPLNNQLSCVPQKVAENQTHEEGEPWR
jgi:hypothetical protein